MRMRAAPIRGGVYGKSYELRIEAGGVYTRMTCHDIGGGHINSLEIRRGSKAQNCVLITVKGFTGVK